jgi:hypothetical protein
VCRSFQRPPCPRSSCRPLSYGWRSPDLAGLGNRTRDHDTRLTSIIEIGVDASLEPARNQPGGRFSKCPTPTYEANRRAFVNQTTGGLASLQFNAVMGSCRPFAGLERSVLTLLPPRRMMDAEWPAM